MKQLIKGQEKSRKRSIVNERERNRMRDPNELLDHLRSLLPVKERSFRDKTENGTQKGNEIAKTYNTSIGS